ncbi:hypothetical protein NBRC116583_34450 [Arenicella sp. 4NH20-0111]|uniref:hypothetical protein n=1 Tax=Arenicella sp. 4NH20-0111 TaxID=3127648 RepID=UPI003104EE43
MIQFHGNAQINVLGEARKPMDDYTLYSYIELKVNNQLIQFRDIYVHDQINAGLVPGTSASVAIASFMEYSVYSLAEPINEMILLKTKNEERIHFTALIEELKKTPRYPKLFLWIILMPIRVVRSTFSSSGVGGLGGLIGGLTVGYCSIFLAPVVAPFTFLKRRRTYRELVKSSKVFLEQTQKFSQNNTEYQLLQEHIEPF